MGKSIKQRLSDAAKEKGQSSMSGFVKPVVEKPADLRETPEIIIDYVLPVEPPKKRKNLSTENFNVISSGDTLVESVEKHEESVDVSLFNDDVDMLPDDDEMPSDDDDFYDDDDSGDSSGIDEDFEHIPDFGNVLERLEKLEKDGVQSLSYSPYPRCSKAIFFALYDHIGIKLMKHSRRSDYEKRYGEYIDALDDYWFGQIYEHDDGLFSRFEALAKLHEATYPPFKEPSKKKKKAKK